MKFGGSFVAYSVPNFYGSFNEYAVKFELEVYTSSLSAIY
jgi:hypothetical protein